MKRSREPNDITEVDARGSTPPSIVDLDKIGVPAAKIVELDSAFAHEDERFTMKCFLPPHKEGLSFKTYEEFEAHYNKVHLNRCLECQKNFPSEHLLNVHFEESHDPFVAVKRDRGEHTYSCFVEGCERKCMTPQKRRLHLIDKHMYPKNFFFAVTRDGIDGRRSLLLEGGHRRRRSSTSFQQSKETRRRASLLESSGGSTKQESAPNKSEGLKAEEKRAKDEEESSEENHDTEMDDLAGAMSALNFVPPHVRFGRGGGRAGFARK